MNYHPIRGSGFIMLPTDRDIRKRRKIVTAFGIAFGLPIALVAAVALILSLVNPPL